MRNEQNNATCSICGKGYYMCLSCKDQKLLAPWKIHTDTSEHYKVFQILHGLSVGIYNEQEAKAKLSNVDLSDKDTFLPNIKRRVNRIMNNFTKSDNKSNVVVNDSKKNIEDKNVEQSDVKDVVEENKTNEKVGKKFLGKKKK